MPGHYCAKFRLKFEIHFGISTLYSYLDPTKKKEPEPKPVVKDTKPTPAPSTAAPEKISTQGFKPVTIAKGRKKKQKLPIQRDGITAENPEKHYNFGDEIGR